jgi:hypothetical protein
MSGESENWNSDSKIQNFGTSYENRYLFLRRSKEYAQAEGVSAGFGVDLEKKVHGRKPSPYKTAGELFFPPNLYLLTHIGKQTYIYSHLLENEQ